MEESPGDFTGAGPVCSLDLTTPMLKCDLCDGGIRLQSHYALIDARTKRFHKVLYETSTRIIDMVAGRKWQQRAIQGHRKSFKAFVVLLCIVFVVAFNVLQILVKFCVR